MQFQFPKTLLFASWHFTFEQWALGGLECGHRSVKSPSLRCFLGQALGCRGLTAHPAAAPGGPVPLCRSLWPSSAGCAHSTCRRALRLCGGGTDNSPPAQAQTRSVCWSVNNVRIRNKNLNPILTRLHKQVVTPKTDHSKFDYIPFLIDVTFLSFYTLYTYSDSWSFYLNVRVIKLV